MHRLSTVIRHRDHNGAVILALLLLPQMAKIHKAAVPLISTNPAAATRDLGAFGKAVEKAQIVGLGEATHGSREIFQLKDRLVRYLVTKQGFRVLAFESNFAQTVAMDRFVRHGVGSAKSALMSQGFWTWQTAEIEQMHNWLRERNQASPKDKVRIVGIDMQDKTVAWMFFAAELKEAGNTHPSLSDPAWLPRMSYEKKLDQVPAIATQMVKASLPRLEKKHGPDAKNLFDRFVHVLRQSIEHGALVSAREDHYERQSALPRMEQISKDAATALSASKPLGEDARKALEILSGKQKSVETAEVRWLADSIEQEEGMADFSDALVVVAALIELKKGTPQEFRDRCMAENVRWSVAGKQKVVFWGHNSHVGVIDMPGKFVSAGHHLARQMGSAYYPLGTLFDRGGFRAVGANGQVASFEVPGAKEGSWDALFNGVEEPLFFLDFASFPQRSWLEATKPTRAIGAGYNPSMPDLYYEPLSVGKLFRGIVFINSLTPASALPPT